MPKASCAYRDKESSEWRKRGRGEKMEYEKLWKEEERGERFSEKGLIGKKVARGD